jgi:hypothetical protein
MWELPIVGQHVKSQISATAEEGGWRAKAFSLSTLDLDRKTGVRASRGV